MPFPHGTRRGEASRLATIDLPWKPAKRRRSDSALVIAFSAASYLGNRDSSLSTYVCQTFRRLIPEQKGHQTSRHHCPWIAPRRAHQVHMSRNGDINMHLTALWTRDSGKAQGARDSTATLHLAGIDDGDGQPDGRQRDGEGNFHAPGGLQDDEGRR